MSKENQENENHVRHVKMLYQLQPCFSEYNSV